MSYSFERICLPKRRREECHKRCKTFTLCTLCKEKYFWQEDKHMAWWWWDLRNCLKGNWESVWNNEKWKSLPWSVYVCMYLYQTLLFVRMVTQYVLQRHSLVQAEFWYWSYRSEKEATVFLSWYEREIYLWRQLNWYLNYIYYSFLEYAYYNI